MLLPCQIVRRSSPQEDYIWTLTGVKNLLQQQEKLVEEIRLLKEEGSEEEIKDAGDGQQPINESDLTTSQSSSMHNLRRILDIEKWKRLSEIFDAEIEQHGWKKE